MQEACSTTLTCITSCHKYALRDCTILQSAPALKAPRLQGFERMGCSCDSIGLLFYVHFLYVDCWQFASMCWRQLALAVVALSDKLPQQQQPETSENFRKLLLQKYQKSL